MHGASYWAEYCIHPENNRSSLLGSAVGTFPGLSSVSPQNSPETGMTMCTPHTPPRRKLRLGAVIQTHADSPSPAVMLVGFEFNPSASKTHVFHHRTTEECLVHLSQGQVPGTALLFLLILLPVHLQLLFFHCHYQSWRDLNGSGRGSCSCPRVATAVRCPQSFLLAPWGHLRKALSLKIN